MGAPYEQQQQRRYQSRGQSDSDLDFFARQGFPDVGAARELMAGLKGMGINAPSHIQAGAFQVMLGPPPQTFVSLCLMCSARDIGASLDGLEHRSTVRAAIDRIGSILCSMPV